MREAVDLRSIILIAILLALYTLSMSIIDTVRDYFAPYTRLELSEVIAYALVFWTLLTLWVAYRRWRQVTLSDQELEEVIAGLNPDVFLVVDPQRRILMCNPQVKGMFGYDPRAVIGKTTDLLYYDRRSADAKGNEIFERLEAFGFHLGFATGKKKDGEHIPLEIITGNLRGRRGAVLLIRDITKLIKAEEAHREKAQLLARLEANYTRLKQTEESRDSLLQMIVHDMKTPLQVIMGNMELMEMDIEGSHPVDPAQLDEAIGHTRRLVEMVNSLLDISRLEAGELPLNVSRYDLRVCARQAVESVRVLADKRSLDLDFPSQPMTVSCDPVILQRVITNLLTNAIKYSPPQSPITLRARLEGDWARMDVIDRGPGIPPEYQEKIFEKFGRVAEEEAARTYSSTGIGLTFCKLAIEAHRGHIGVESRDGKGSDFWFEIPAAQEASPASLAAATTRADAG